MLNSAKILVVDDTPANLEVITETLACGDYQVAVAISGERALARLETYVPDLILLDVQMPGIDGFETCQKIKANAALADIPVIFITALSNSESVVKGFSLGAVDYISKPFREPELLARVNTHLQLRQLTESLAQQVSARTQSLESAMDQLKSSQIQLVQQEKMSALGGLIAGVAHEINNPIGFVRGNVKELRRNIQDIFEHLSLYQEQIPAEELEEHAEEIDLEFLMEDIPKMLDSMFVGCDRIRDISRSLRTFSRADQTIQTTFNVHDGIESTLLILKHRLKANDHHPEIEVVKYYGDLPDIACFPGQLNQVFMNILANAVDALEECRQKKMPAEMDAVAPQITVKTAAAGGQVYIHIRDNGPGMPEAVRQHIFDHLYTTKEVGKGTGLGLAIAHQIIVEKHHGRITVDSTPNHGTEFILELPTQTPA
ncbi:MAG: response regulator [Cyanobacteria bacterium J06555_13]